MAVKTKPRRSWQRMVLSVFGVLIIQFTWRWAVAHLYTLPPHTIAAFVTLTTNTMYTISAIVVFMVTGKLVYDWRNTTEAVANVASTVTEQISHVIEEGQPGAPAVRPFSQHATEES